MSRKDADQGKPKRAKKLKKPITPRSHIMHGLRLLWLHSRERRECLRLAGHSCERCGVKASVAKGQEQKVQVHHRDGINWDGVVDLFIRRVLPPVDRLEAICPECHGKEHDNGNT